MSDAIVVLNAGSSSLKFSLYQVNDEQLALVARGQIEGLGTSPRFKAKDRKGSILIDQDLSGSAPRFGQSEALAHLVKWTRDHFATTLSPIAVGHRVVHGGVEFSEPTLLTDE